MSLYVKGRAQVWVEPCTSRRTLRRPLVARGRILHTPARMKYPSPENMQSSCCREDTCPSRHGAGMSAGQFTRFHNKIPVMRRRLQRCTPTGNHAHGRLPAASFDMVGIGRSRVLFGHNFSLFETRARMVHMQVSSVSCHLLFCRHLAQSLLLCWRTHVNESSLRYVICHADLIL